MTEHDPLEPREASSSIKAVSLYEIAKGLGAISAACALWLWHSNLLDWLDDIEATWLARFGSMFNPQIESIVKLAKRATENWHWFFILVLSYAVVRFIEAYGLWHDKTWAYWFSVLGYGVFIPLEVYYLIVRPFDWVKLLILVLNVLVVLIVYRQMRAKHLI